MKPALTMPMTTATASETSIAIPTGQPRCALSTAMIIAERVRTLATERSKSPAFRGMMSASVSTTSTACEPRMVEMFAHERKASGRRTPKTATSTSSAPTRA